MQNCEHDIILQSLKKYIHTRLCKRVKFKIIKPRQQNKKVYKI